MNIEKKDNLGYTEGLAAIIARLRRALRRGARAADPQNSLAVAQLELLSAINEHPSIRPSQLASRLHMRRNTVTTILNSLVQQDLVTRKPFDKDGRVVELTASNKGRQAVLVWQSTNAAILNLALQNLTESQRRDLKAAMAALDSLASSIDDLSEREQEQE